MGAVCGAYLYQFATRTAHDVRDAKGTTNFNQFTARHDHLPAGRKRCQYQKHSRRVVVDHSSCFAAGKLNQQAFNVAVAVAAATASQVELEVAKALHGGHGSGNCFRRKYGTAQIGVQDCAGQIKYRLERRPGLSVEAGRAVFDALGRVKL